MKFTTHFQSAPHIVGSSTPHFFPKQPSALNYPHKEVIPTSPHLRGLCLQTLIKRICDQSEYQDFGGKHEAVVD